MRRALPPNTTTSALAPTSTPLLTPIKTLALGLLIGALGCWADARAGDLRCDRPAADAGIAWRGDEVRVTYPLRNDGDAPLAITRVDAGCGCATAEYPRKLAPGASGQLVVLMNTSGFRGPLIKRLSVVSDRGSVALTLRLQVRALVEMDTPFVRVMTIAGRSETRSLELSPPPHVDRGRFAIRIDDTSKHVQAKLGAPDERGARWLSVTLLPSAPVGRVQGWVDLAMCHHEDRIVRVDVSGLVRPPLRARPARLSLGAEQAEVTLDALDGQRFQVTSAVWVSPAGDRTRELSFAIAARRPLGVTVRLESATPLERGAVLIRTSHPLAAELRLTIAERARPSR